MNKLKLYLVMGMGIKLLLVLVGCGGNTKSGSTVSQPNVSRDAVYEFYDKVQFDQTKEQVDAILGVIPTESTQLKNSFTYVNEDTSFGVSVLFDEENGLATSKTLFYSMTEDLAFLTKKAVTEELAESIPNGSTYDEVKNILGGEGTETSATQIPFEDNKVSYIRIWVNQDGTMLQTVFLTDGTTNNVMFFD